MSSAVPELPVADSQRGRLQVRCADVHPIRCPVEVFGDTFDELTARASQHGAIAHGFTPSWYTARRIAAMTASATLRGTPR